MRCYLRFERDALEDAKPFPSVRAAVEEFQRVALELDRVGQKIEATIHYRDERQHDEPKCAEYPDWVLSLYPSGNVRKDPT